MPNLRRFRTSPASFVLRGGTARAFAALSGIAAAASAQIVTPFSNEAPERGVSYVYGQGMTQTGMGSGVLLADLNGDTWPDLVTMGAKDGRIGVFLNVGGTFSDITVLSGVQPALGASGIVAGDYDGDGDLDLYITVFGGRTFLYRNKGNAQFADVTLQAGVMHYAANEAACFGDYNGDGWLDLYLCVHELPQFPGAIDRLWRNNGNGTFSDVTLTLGLNVPTPSFGASFFDIDLDADSDLYVFTDHGTSVPANRCYLLENLGGSFKDITQSSGTTANIDAMGLAIGDWDGNGYPDFFLTNIPNGHKLFLNDGDRTFTDASAAAGVQGFNIGWASSFIDLNNDGDEELFVNVMDKPNSVYDCFFGQFPALDIAQAYNLADPAQSFTHALGDIDKDGDIDIVQSNLGQPIKIMINYEGSKRSWARFRVVGLGANTHGIGTRLVVTVDGVSQWREIIAGNNYKSMNEPIAHLGLGSASTVDTIAVTWIGGTTRTLTNYPAKKEWTVYPPDRLGDVNNDGELNAIDLSACVLALAGSPQVSPGSELFDFNGDGKLDAADGLAMRNAYLAQARDSK